MKEIHKSRLDGFTLLIATVFVLLTLWLGTQVFILLIPMIFIWFFSHEMAVYEEKRSKIN